MVAPPSPALIAMQTVPIIIDSVGSLITINEALARIQLLRRIPEPRMENTRPSHREVLDYMNYQTEADDLEYQVNFILYGLLE